MLELNFVFISEEQPGQKWQKLFRTHWAAYKNWFVSKGAAASPDLRTSVKNLKRFMPKFVPTYERLCDLADGDEIAERFFTGYQPPAYITGCSQAIWKKEVQLVRNYDYHPELSEGTILHSAWNGKKVIAIGDCLSGVVDGMNEDGLVASLTFGGRKVVGKGFGVPFILRYLLEFSSNVPEAVEALRGIPTHMAYNIMLLDRSGTYKVVQIAPDRDPVVSDAPFSTNHQGAIDWPEHAAFSKTLAREQHLKTMLADENRDGNGIVDAFLKAPLYNRRYQEGFGTLYTAVYSPREEMLELVWPEQQIHQSFTDFREGTTKVSYREWSPVPAPHTTPAVTTVPAQVEPQIKEAAYWIAYGQSWANGDPLRLGEKLASTMIQALPNLSGDRIKEINEAFLSSKKRGTIPWEIFADLWGNYQGE